MSDSSVMYSPKPLSLHAFRKQRKPLRNVNREAYENLSPMDRLACWITDRVGSMSFFLIVLIWTVLWLGWNLLAPTNLQFDPPMAFVFWLFISNLIQLLLHNVPRTADIFTRCGQGCDVSYWAHRVDDCRRCLVLGIADEDADMAKSTLLTCPQYGRSYQAARSQTEICRPISTTAPGGKRKKSLTWTELRCMKANIDSSQRGSAGPLSRWTIVSCPT
jgi:hypothetical protein